MAELGAKKERNYLLDFFKVLATVCACLAHFNSMFLTNFAGSPIMTGWPVNPGVQGAYIFNTYWTEVLGMCGYRAISFFTFTTGFWFMNSFKRDQKKNIFGKGKDTLIVFRYWAGNYASYWPYILFATLWAIAFTYIIIPDLHTDFDALLKNLIMSIPQLMGFASCGMGPDALGGTWANSFLGLAALTENFAISPKDVLVAWNSPLWYMFALVAILGFVYVIFMKSEAFGLFGFCPIMMSLYYTTWSLPTGAGFWAQFLESSVIRLCGPMVWGVWGWYIVDFIKKQDFSKKAKIGITVVSVLAFCLRAYARIFGGCSFIIDDIAVAALLIFVLAQKDYFTVALNKLCSHIPGIKFAGTIALGLYNIHYPISCFLGWLGLQDQYYQEFASFLRGFTVNQLALMYLGLLFALCIPFFFVDKYLLKRLSAWVLKITKAKEPVVIEAPAEAK